MKYKKIVNRGVISVQGGEGGERGCGEGSGGRMKLECLEYSLPDVGFFNCEQEIEREGIKVNKGRREWDTSIPQTVRDRYEGQDGSIYKSICEMGEEIKGGTCEPCE